MTEEEELDFLWQLALPYGSTGWKTSDCPVVRTTTKKVRSALQTAKKSIEWKGIKHCELAIQAQARFRKDNYNGRPPQPVGLSVWLNEERWTMMLEPEEKKETIVSKCQCGEPVHGPQYNKCTICLGYKNGKLVTPYADKMREYYINQDLNHKYLSKIVRPGEIAKIMKIINVWSNTTHNAHVRKYNSIKYTNNP